MLHTVSVIDPIRSFNFGKGERSCVWVGGIVLFPIMYYEFFFRVYYYRARYLNVRFDSICLFYFERKKDQNFYPS